MSKKMVSEGKILGKPVVIFVTVGSTEFQFDRLLSSVDNSLQKTKINCQLIVQGENINHVWKHKNIKIIRSMTPQQLITMIKKADKIITHGGPISVYQIVKNAKSIPCVIPRMGKFKEHVDSHQLFFIKFLRNYLPKKYCRYFLMKTSIEKDIGKYILERPQKNYLSRYIFINERNHLKRQLQGFVENSQ